MNRKLFSSFLAHFVLFVVVELIFVLVIFREIHFGDWWTWAGLLHLSYRGVIIGAGRLRKYTTSVRQKFFTTYVPVVYHLVIHFVAGLFLVQESLALHPELEHHEESIGWMIGLTVLVGVLIAGGEYVLHRYLHCETHHHHAHVHCHDEECETIHGSPKKI